MSRINFLENFDYLKLDFVLIALFFVLGFCGLLILASASVHFSDSIYGNPSAVFNRQFFYFLLGISGLLIFFLLPLSFWSNYDRLLLTLGFLLLLLVLFLVWVLKLMEQIGGSDLLGLVCSLQR